MAREIIRKINPLYFSAKKLHADCFTIFIFEINIHSLLLIDVHEKMDVGMKMIVHSVNEKI